MNPILMMSGLERAKGIISLIKTAKDPVGELSNNPQMMEVMQMVRGKNPEEVFYNKCKEMNIDPNVILGMLR